MSELDNLTYDNEEDFLFSSEYRSLASSYYRKQSTELAKKDSIAQGIAYLKVVSEIPNEIIKNNSLFYDARYGITFTNDLETYYNIFISASTNEAHRKKITESYNKLKTVAKGQPSPKFLNYENYKGGTTSLSDLKGAYVYIDVWATWCGPCKAEIPSLKKVENAYHGKNIQFVSISIDDDRTHDGSWDKAREDWKAMVADKELGGLQLFAPKGWKSQFVVDYKINGIPRFLLIDPDGNIVTPDAPRPSSEKLIELFNSLEI